MKVSLGLFFTRGVSLGTWKKTGILRREVILYKGIATYLDRIHFYTYGDPQTENEIAKDFHEAGIRVFPKRCLIPATPYSIILPLIERASLGQLDVFKTNQIDGGLTAVLAKRIYGKPLIVRCGYLWSEHAGARDGARWKQVVAKGVEAIAFREADQIIVSTSRHRDKIVQQYKISPTKILLIPNYVDIDLMKQNPEAPVVPGRIGFVGRLEPQKNLEALLRAVARLDPPAHLVLIGEGSERPKLERLAREIGCRVHFVGAVPHEQLPAILNRCQVFVLPSLYEGMPKALIEAMACGLPIVATDIPGNREIVEHGKTGLLCDTSAESIQSALALVLGNPELRRELGENAARVARKTYSLENALQLELNVIAKLVAGISDV